MGHHCCVPDCSSNSRFSANGGLTFHAFPMDPKERKQWILSVRRADYKKLTVNKHTKVCSRHFREEDFIQSQGSKRRMLKKGVVPSVFSWTNENQGAKDSLKKIEPSKQYDDLPAKEISKTHHSNGTKSSNGTKRFEAKTKSESSELGNEENNERKINNKNIKKDNDNPVDIPAPPGSYGSPTKSDDSEQGSISDLTPTNGSSPVSSTNGTSSRKSSTLNFQIGTRLEAKDLGNEIWYPVKVVEVDWDDEEILIHFEKWSQRYDEWVPMDSSRLRPSQNPIPQTDGKNSSKVFNVGDRVMAKWSDCRRYPAKVKAVLGNDRYEVLFFDGFTKNIKGIRMTKLEGETQNGNERKPEPPEKEVVRPISKPIVKNTLTEEAIGTKEERRERKRKINVAELFHPKKRMKLDAGLLSPNSGDSDKKKKVGRGRRRKKIQGQAVESVDNEGEKTPVSQDTNVSVEDSVQGSELEVAVEEKKVVEDVVIRQKKKRGRRFSGGGGESADKPRRGLRQGETPGKAKSIEVKSYTRKIPRKISPGVQESPSAPTKPRQDSSKGHAEDNDKPKGKKGDLSDESSKPTNKPDQKEGDKEEEEKWIPDGQDGYIVESADGPRKTTVIPDKKLPSGWSKHSIQRKHGNSAGKWDVFLVNPQGRRFRSRHELRQYFEENGEPFKSEMFDFCLSGKRRSRNSDGSTPGVRRPRGPKAKLHTSPGSDGIDQQPHTSPLQQQQHSPQQPTPVPPQRRVKTLLPKIRHISASQSEEDSGEKHLDPPSPPPPYTTTVASVPAVKIEPEILEGEVLVGGLKIQMDGNSYKCPKESCGKNFRKENLLQMHIKHYHPEYNRFMGSTPNVADLAYARTIGESIDDLMPKSRYSTTGSVGVAGTAYMEKMNRFETNRKNKSGVAIGAGIGKGGGGGCSGDGSPVPDKKKMTYKEKLLISLAMKKASKGVADSEVRATVDDTIGDIKEPSEERTNITDNQENVPAAVGDSTGTLPYREEKKEPQTTIKTLLPVIRSPSHSQDTSSAERLKTKFPTVEEGEEYVEVIDVGTRQVQPAHVTSHLPTSQSFAANSHGTNVTKSLRTIRRRRLSDFHFEPLHKRRKIATKLEVTEDVDVDVGGSPVDLVTTPSGPNVTGTLSSGKSTPTYRYSRKKTPIVHLEKLNVTTDSNGRVILSPSVKEKPESKLLETPAQTSIIEQLRKEELINCTCGFMEEDGLMIQCDLCLCWQHGICNNIEKESDVPEKYVCPICLNPYRQRKSKKYMHDQDWLKEGKLPSLSFRSKNEANILDREAVLKRSHDLTGSLLQIQQVLHSLRVKVNIAGKPDHPKLYLWAKSWEKDLESSSSTQQVSETQSQIVTEGEFKEHLDSAVSCCQNEMKTDICPGTDVLVHKDIVPDTDISKKTMQESVNSVKEECIETLQGGGVAGGDEIEDVQIKTEILRPETDVRLPEVVVEAETSIEQQYVEETIITDAEITRPMKMEVNVESDEHSEQTNPEVVPAPNVGTEVECSSNVECIENSEIVPVETHDLETADTSSKNLSSSSETKVEETNKGSVSEIDKTADSNQIAHQLQDEESDTGIMDKQKEITVDNDASVIEDNVQTTVEVTDSDVTSAPEIVVNDGDSKLVEENKNFSADEKPGDTDEVSSQLESHGLLHQALTNGTHATNTINNVSLGSQIDASGHPMLQLPICQSELMQFASTMADNLRVTESRPSAAAPVPVPEPPRVPQPEAPIDPVECRLLLLDHIDHFQQQIDTRLTMLEEQVAALESQDPDAATDEAHDHYPQTKQTIQMLLRDLLTMRRIAALN